MRLPFPPWLGILLFTSTAPAGNPVLEWNEAMIVAIRKDAIPPDLVARSLAIMHLAIRDAQISAGTKQAEVAITQAACTAATALMPSHRPEFETLRDRTFAALGDPAKDPESLNIGTVAAQKILHERADDGSSVLVSYVPSIKPGQWRRTPPFFRPPELPQFASKVRPFVLKAPEQFRPAGPPSMGDAAWVKALNELKELGGKASATRSAEQTEIARFWADFSYTETPPGHWNSIARTIAIDRKLSVAETAQIFATLNVVLFDTAIACWDAKYTFNLWRPATAIPRAAEDGNAATEPDPQWVSFLNTPAHPEYVSGHSAFSAGAAAVLTHYLRTDAVTFIARSDTLPKAERKFTSLRACADECGASRVYGGIHYRFSCEDGAELGRKIAEFVVSQRK